MSWSKLSKQLIPEARGPYFHSNRTMLRCESLVFGYVRQHNIDINIPTVLVKLCSSYYKKIFYWNLTTDSLLTYNEDILSNAFNINDIIFQCALKRLNTGYIQITFIVNSNVYGYNIYFISFITSDYEINCENQYVKLFFSGKLSLVPFLYRKGSFLKSSKDIQILDINKSDKSIQTHNQLTNLTIKFCLDILQIKYKAHGTNLIQQPPHPRSNVSMYEKVKMEWKLHETLLFNFKSIDKKSPYPEVYHGPIFNDDKFDKTWKLAFVPYINERKYLPVSHVSYYPEGTIFIIKLRQRSSAFSCIKAKIETNIFYDGYQLNIISNHNFRRSYVCCKVNFKFTKSIEQINDLLFKVQIEISELIDCNGQIIPKSKWREYNVLHNNI